MKRILCFAVIPLLRYRWNYSVGLLLLLAAVATNFNAQSKDRDSPTQLTSNEISGLVDSESRGNFYYYSFMAGPGEVEITLTVEPGRKASDNQFIAFTGVEFKLFDRNAAEIAGKEVSTSNGNGAKQAIARVEITRRQLVVLSVNVKDKDPYNGVGGKYRLRINGAVDVTQGKSDGGLTQTDIDAASSAGRGGCLPKQGTLIVKMKDGTKKIIDLSEAAEVTIVP